ncbi:MAG TPA: GxxExxY protein [Terriglobia bacterium]|nr:GxxExxY protein [Terriglobia bacterium]
MKLTGRIIGAALEVHNLPGPGFVESIYHRALLHELNLCSLFTQTEHRIEIHYKDLIVGKHRLDIIVERMVVVEVKAVNAIADVHIAQTLSYLKATSLELALIFNFGQPQLSWKRLINSRQCRELRELF